MKIRGRTVMTPVPKSDWNQADPKKADYIKNKPTEQEVVRGYSAYQVAVMNGFDGTEEEWLLSLRGAVGPRGEAGPAGAAGPAGPAGDPGYTPVKGVDYFTEDDQEAIVEEVLKQMPEAPEAVDAVLSGKWCMTTPENLSETVVPAMVQEVNFESEVSLYSDNTFLPSDSNSVASTHKVVCKAMEIAYLEAPGHKYTVIFYHVESTDAEFMEKIQMEDGRNLVIAYGYGKWNSDAARVMDFGTVQNVSAEFKEVLEAVAVPSVERGAELVSVSITEAADGTVTMVNTLDNSTETIVIGADANGNPNSLTYNGVEIPFSYTKEEAAETEATE